MKKNLNDDTRYAKKWDDTPIEKKSEWLPFALLIATILLLAYFILG
ncbi:MAG: hypothetical protein ACOY3V_00210 [Pseudomonadota bacterium]